jgi:hypothetical protein
MQVSAPSLRVAVPACGKTKNAARARGRKRNGRRFVVAVALAVAAAVGEIHNHVAIGIFVLLIWLSAFWVAARMNQHRLRNERYSRGPGLWLGLLISKTTSSLLVGSASSWASESAYLASPALWDRQGGATGGLRICVGCRRVVDERSWCFPRSLRRCVGGRRRTFDYNYVAPAQATRRGSSRR